MAFLPDVDYEDHPATVRVKLAGQELPWFLGTESFHIARDHDVDVADILSSLEALSKDAGDGAAVTEALTSVSDLVWAGFLVFDPDITRKQVRRLISVPVRPELLRPIKAHLSDLSDEQLEEMAPDTGGGSDAEK